MNQMDTKEGTYFAVGRPDTFIGKHASIDDAVQEGKELVRRGGAEYHVFKLVARVRGETHATVETVE